MRRPLATLRLGCNVVQGVLADPHRSGDPKVPRRAISAGPAISTGPADRRKGTSADPADRRKGTSAGDPTTTTGDRRGIRATTIGVADSTAPHGAATYHRGAGVHRHHRRGPDHCQTHGARRRRPSTTGASRNNRCGIPATTNGASISSGSGFRSRSDPAKGRPLRLPERPSFQFKSPERVADRQVLEAADEDRGDMRGFAGQLDRLQPRDELGEEAVDLHAGQRSA